MPKSAVIGVRGKVLTAAISKSTSGAGDLVAAVAGKCITVLALTLCASGGANTNVAIQGSGDHTRFMDLPADVPWSLPFCPVGWFTCARGVSLKMFQSNALLIAGHVLYILTDAKPVGGTS